MTDSIHINVQLRALALLEDLVDKRNDVYCKYNWDCWHDGEGWADLDKALVDALVAGGLIEVTVNEWRTRKVAPTERGKALIAELKQVKRDGWLWQNKRKFALLMSAGRSRD